VGAALCIQQLVSGAALCIQQLVSGAALCIHITVSIIKHKLFGYFLCK
jgi:hypothetical protein